MKKRMRLQLFFAALPFSSTAFAQTPPPEGRAVYQSHCASCHGGDNAQASFGPSLVGVFGKLAASVPGFAYSSAMRNAKLVWDAETLDRFLAAPTKLVPGTKMPVALSRPADRAEVIAYLKQQAK
ncbi:c-type cytochrome [Novosphingobium sp. SG707]|uniref:c-type cytochrome n=1 Tax=Novosphingobium sp. SG707 TaxID=2586996 RepID=UPI0014453ADA|nr:c-type cytochrome [Novosphingobium sp. SG707]NKJ02369.1 cytochrome c [Novosphingobium sp. SG707]